MDEDMEELVIGIRADTRAFARDVATMRSELEGPLAAGAQRAGRMIEGSLVRAAAQGKFGFDDLKKVAISALSEIAAASMRSMFASAGPSGGGLLGGLLGSLLGGTSGPPGRATGGPVNQGRPYLVGERGPEVFVPSSGGRIVASETARRDVRVAISLRSEAPASESAMLRQSARPIARPLRRSVRDA